VSKFQKKKHYVSKLSDKFVTLAFLRFCYLSFLTVFWAENYLMFCLQHDWEFLSTIYFYRKNKLVSAVVSFWLKIKLWLVIKHVICITSIELRLSLVTRLFIDVLCFPWTIFNSFSSYFRHKKQNAMLVI
jgi:hypothetical protein